MKRPPKKAAQNSDPERAPGRPFPKGVSGNPGGRPKAVKELLDLARGEVPASFDLAVKLRDDEAQDGRVRLEAAKFLTAYGLGAPPKEPPKDDIEDLSDEELEREVKNALADRRVKARSDGPATRTH